MGVLDETWVPTSGQRRLAEKYIYPVVRFGKLFTSWYSVLLWAFLFPYLAGESLLFSIIFSSLCSTISWYIWMEE